jgi:hypothetical protein
MAEDESVLPNTLQKIGVASDHGGFGTKTHLTGMFSGLVPVVAGQAFGRS